MQEYFDTVRLVVIKKILSDINEDLRIKSILKIVIRTKRKPKPLRHSLNSKLFRVCLGFFPRRFVSYLYNEVLLLSMNELHAENLEAPALRLSTR